MRRAFIDTEVIDEFVNLSRQIAARNGYTDLENGLQRLSILEAKYAAEVMELSESLHKERVWQFSEAGDCLKYAACVDTQTGRQDYPCYTDTLALLASFRYKMSQREAEVAGLAKYRLRTSLPYRKESETAEEKAAREQHENEVIQAALEEAQNWPGWPLPEVAERENIPLPTLYYAAEHKLIPSREAGKTVLIDLQDYLWYAWKAKYKYGRK